MVTSQLRTKLSGPGYFAQLGYIKWNH